MWLTSGLRSSHGHGQIYLFGDDAILRLAKVHMRSLLVILYLAGFHQQLACCYDRLLKSRFDRLLGYGVKHGWLQNSSISFVRVNRIMHKVYILQSHCLQSEGIFAGVGNIQKAIIVFMFAVYLT